MRYLFEPHDSYRSILGRVGALLFVSSTAVACQHAQAVKDLIPDKEGGDSEDNGGGKVDVVIPDRSQGEEPTAALKTRSEILETEDLAVAIVEENGRVSCGERLIREKYVPDPAHKEEAQALLSKMDIDQKVVQLTGMESPDYNDASRFDDIQRSRDDEATGIRGYRWRDGPHGLNLESGAGRSRLQNYSTSFPTSVAQGATFDMDIVFEVGQAIADETLALGDNVLLGPCMNILRHPYWGRAQETFGEDVYHLGRIGTAFTEGLQQHIAGCAKHYVANNIENERFDINAQMDEQTLREIYGRHFEMVVRDGGVACMMASYNSVNGTKSTQNSHTLTEMLRNDMGFKGFVLTDWWAMPGAASGQGPIDAPQDRQTAAASLKAGLDVEVPWALNYDAIPALVEEGAIDERMVDRAVLRVLEQKLRFNSAYLDETDGLKPPTTTYESEPGSIVGSEQHADLAEEMAEKAMVLLRNENGALPIPSDVTTVAIIGKTVDYFVKSDNPPERTFNFVTDAALGDRGSSRVRPDPALTVGPLDGLRAAAPSGVNVIFGDTAADAQGADFVVVIAGLTPGDEGEEYTGASDREDLSLGGIHDDLIRSVIDTVNVPVAVVIEAGGVVDMPWISDVDAAIMAWYPGQRGGAALGRLLFGQANFSGRLPVTWPKSADDFPEFNEGDTTEMDYYVGYRRFDRMGLEPLYAFGHGLSYSNFRYERLHIPCEETSSGGLIEVEVDVKNTSDREGDEVVMVFASFPETRVRRSVKELKGFARVELKAGEKKRVTIPIRVEDLKYWDMDQGEWVVESGPVLLQVGPSSDRLHPDLKQTVMVHPVAIPEEVQ